MRRLLTTTALSALFIATATAAWSSDGKMEINHTCATQTGCFLGDAPGYPVTIPIGGSYRLTNNLIIPNENTTGIEIVGPNVSIDLGGFFIARAACVLATGDCRPSSLGTGYGVVSSVPGVTVTNGSIIGMGADGVSLRGHSVVRNLRVQWSKGHGIQTQENSIIAENTAFQNGSAGSFFTTTGGIRSGEGSTITGNASRGNFGHGINGGFGSTISENAASQNGKSGIFGPGCVISSNSTLSNTEEGILGGGGSQISNNIAYLNGTTGIEAGSGSSVTDNTSSANSSYGIHVQDDTSYRGNTVTSNSSGTILGSGVNMFSNSCNGNSFCP